MPGTPATSPRFGIARYADGDTASFSAQVNPITDGFDARAAMTWNYLAKSTAYTANEGDYVYTAAGVTITLPTATAGRAVAVQADGSATGASPVTVSTGGAATIKGGGLSGSTSSFVLGTPGATAVLLADGTNWHFVAGQQDTGWVNLTLSSAPSVTVPAGAYTPAVRMQGDVVRFKGTMQNNSGAAISPATAWATAPSWFRPANSWGMAIPCGGAAIAFSYVSTFPGSIFAQANVNASGTFELDGVTLTMA